MQKSGNNTKSKRHRWSLWTRNGVGCFVFVILLSIAASISAQTIYPTTQYQGFPTLAYHDDFATTRPYSLDSTKPLHGRDFRSMSPDSWESPGDTAFQRTIHSSHGTPVQLGMESESFHSRGQTSLSNFPAFESSGSRQHNVQQNPFHSTSHGSKSVIESPSHSLGVTPPMPTDIRLPENRSGDGSFHPENERDGKSFTELSDLDAQLPYSFQNTPLNDHQPDHSNALEGTGSKRYPLFPQQDNGSIIQLPQRNGVNVDHQYGHPSFAPDATQPSRRYEFYPNDPINSYSPANGIDPVHNRPPISVQSTPAFWPSPNYRPDLGHRAPLSTTRDFGWEDYGQTFDFEKKHDEYPPLSEVLATGKYFATVSAMYIRPSFQANASIFKNISGITETFEFSYKLAPHFQIGFESKFGPGIEFDYFGYHDFSSQASFISNGTETGTISAWLRGANQWTRLTADDANERLTANHRVELDVIGVSFFKEVALKKARINGKFGFQTAHIIHELVADVRTPSAVVGALRARSDTRGYGPRFLLEYFRPIGHTRLEFLSSIGGSVMFGEQSQVIENTDGISQSRLNAHEFMLTIDYFSGVQYRKMYAENRYVFVRGGVLYQAWIHGGTAVQPQDDFGLNGFSLTAGVNR